MNKKILMISTILLAVGMLVTPVWARGPVNAEIKNDNPNMDVIYNIVEVQMLEQTLPSGVILRWIYFPMVPSIVHVKVKFATEFSNPELLDVGNNFMMWLTNPDYRQKWVHMNKAGYLGLFAIFGFPEPDCPTEGVYIWGKETLLS